MAALGVDAWARGRRYAELVAEGMKEDRVEKLRRGTRKGPYTWSQGVQAAMEMVLARRLGDGQRGKPKKGFDPFSR